MSSVQQGRAIRDSHDLEHSAGTRALSRSSTAGSPDGPVFCVVIPCFNHAATLLTVAQAAAGCCPVVVVDDGSTEPLSEMPDYTLVRLAQNSGKGAALRAGLERAAALGFSHAITMDADGQHFSEDLPKFIAAASAQPNALVVGLRDFYAAGCPTHRRRSNAVSTFWFRVETGVRLGDTQCGFRCYPLALFRRLSVRSERYAFELEFMVRAAWVGTAIVGIPVRCTYADGIRNSHFRPVRDLAHITFMNIGLVLQSWAVPRSLREAWSCGEERTLRTTFGQFFSEHAHDPRQVSLAVGLGLFFGIAPFWGFQMLIAAACAHRLRLNKAITLVASNISMPPTLPLIFGGSMTLGHWIFTGRTLEWPLSRLTTELAVEYAWQWVVGSFALATIVAVSGAAMTYAIAHMVRSK